MKRNSSLNFFTISGLILVLGILSVNFYASRVQAQASENSVAAGIGTAFTYQGLLKDGGALAEGDYDLQFLLYDAAASGTQVGSTVDVPNIDVTEGLFTVPLDFGDVFDGTAYWLQIAVRAGESTGGYTNLLPRQPLAPTPYALYAENSLGSLSCTTDQIAKYDGSKWICTTDQSADLAHRLAKLEYKLVHLRRSGDDVYFVGANLHVNNGTGSTDTSNELGNIIIGYNEKRDYTDSVNVRTGSHMLVVGKEHNYSTFGGIVVGHRNTTSGNWSSVSGGFSNTASGSNSSILGGEGNSATGPLATVSGGRDNIAGGGRSSVSGGAHREIPSGGNYDWAAGSQYEDDSW